MAEKTAFTRSNTPVGFAKWAHVLTPKPAFKGQADKAPKYQVDICFDPKDPAWSAWGMALQEAIKALPTQIDKRTDQPLPKQMPIKRELDQEEKPTGRYYVTFKTGIKFKPAMFDKYGQQMENVPIGNESKIRINYTTSVYDTFGGGIALYLNAIQVLELVEFKPQTAKAFGFEVEKQPENDPFAPPGMMLPPQEPPSNRWGPPHGEDDLPF